MDAQDSSSVDDALPHQVPGESLTVDGRVAPSGGERPRRLVVVCGTGTEVGKTWVACALLREWRRLGLHVAARKPAQSYDVDEASGGAPSSPTDAERLAAASGEGPADVCPPHRSYPAGLAPPMAAEALGRPAFCVADLVSELRWPQERVDVGLVELAGGVASPQAADGAGTELVERLLPDAAVLVADPGLGTINAVRLSLAALAPVLPRPEGTPAPVL
ncbi:MAG TPA: dethiobiotin synthase, partial [Acidimicrobiales bacterium]|nr:dethiobiotin synthase [Acidimicrobiales bacterium]